MNQHIKHKTLIDEDLRIIANAEQFYTHYVDVIRELRALPRYMTWKNNYLYSSADGKTEKSLGVRSPATTDIYENFTQAKKSLEERAHSMRERLMSNMRQYKALRLPQLMTLPGKILREMDARGLLGTDFIVVGTNAFAAYEIEARERFAHGLDETEDFDLGWCRGSGVSLAQTCERPSGSPLFSVLKAVDQTFRMSSSKAYQAVNKDAYEVELLAAPSVIRTMSPDELFSPYAIHEQEWLLLGRPIRHVVCDRSGEPAPVVVPDPRWMALHKMWLSKKPERRADKKEKDFRQGDLLLDAVTRKMRDTYPVDVDFVLSLPPELLPVFNQWASIHSFIPADVHHQPEWMYGGDQPQR